jgi:hypothetical protein
VIEAPCTSPDALMFDDLAFDAAQGAAGTAPGGTSGEQAFFVSRHSLFVLVFVLFNSTCWPHLLECLVNSSGIFL